jgi:NAD(P)-dependent dehydrogenase (short-subunit alcohol dehydrogenase family)
VPITGELVRLHSEEGERVLLSVMLGMRESQEDWLELGRDLIARGLGAPLLGSWICPIGEGALACPTDVSDHHAVAQMAERIRAEEGVPDVVVNNAGAGRFLFIEETSPEELVQMTAVPYHAAFFVTRAFIVEMLARRSGRIVNVSTPPTHPGRARPATRARAGRCAASRRR